MKQRIHTSEAPPPGGPYSQGVLWNGLLFTAGVVPIDPATGLVVGTTIEEQTHQVMKNLRAILQAAEMDFHHAIKVTVHLARLLDDFAGFNRAYDSYFEPESRPVRTTVGSVLNGILVEIDLIAGKDS